MSTTWTKDQKKAIESTGSVIISASAGTGKTAVLTEKVFRMLINGTKIENLLIMTFSNKAAEEMLVRIKDKLTSRFEELKIAPETVENKAQKMVIYDQLKNFSNANIQTIHSFCYNVIKKYYYNIPGLDPKFSIGDEVKVNILKFQAINEILEEYYKKPSSEFNNLFNSMDNKETLEQSLVGLYNSIINTISPVDWMNNCAEKYNINPTSIPEFMLDELLKDFEKYSKIYSLILRELSCIKTDKKTQKYADAVKMEASIIANVYSNLKAKNLYSITSNTFDNFGSTLKFPEDFSTIKDLRDSIKTEIVEKYKKTAFSTSEQVRRIAFMYPTAKLLAELFSKIDKKYKELKSAEKIIDFNDMEHYCHQILKDSYIANMYKNQFSMVFVDEYQDTSPIQEEIIKMISNDNNVFCVGDLKQSIYRFRSSDPTIFNERMKKYEKGIEGTLISLSNNFRSSANILNCANDVFCHITNNSKEIKYTSTDKLVYSRADAVSSTIPVEINILSKENIDTSTNSISSTEIEIYNMVRIIKENIGQPIYDAKQKIMRPATFGDICILTRNISGYIETFNKIFIANQIPFVIDKVQDIFMQNEIKTLVSIMELILNHNNDIAYLTIMHNGLFNFTDEDIMAIRKIDSNKNLYYNIESCTHSKSKVPVALKNKCQILLGFIEDCKKKERTYSLSELVAYVINTSNMKDIFAVEKNGNKKIANLDLIISYASQYEKRNHNKIYGFLKMINDLDNINVGLSEAQTNWSTNQVRITTIHKSKGLEYPIVILGFMGKSFSNKDRTSNIVVDKNIGFGLKYSDATKHQLGTTFLRKIITSEIENKTREEEMRLLYVAMTRAQEKLYIQGSIENSWKDISSSRNMNDWIYSTVLDIDEYNLGSIVLKKSLVGTWNIKTIKAEDLNDVITSKASLPDVDAMLNKLTLRSSKPIEKKPNTTSLVPKIASASQIEKMSQYNINSFARPSFMQKKNYTEIGICVHKLFRYVDFNKDISVKGINNQIKDIVSHNYMSQKEIDIIPSEFIVSVSKILSSPLFTSFKGAQILKEQSIYSSFNYNEIFDGTTNDKDVILRCIVDLAVITNDGIYIIDYKTDNIGDDLDNLENIISEHEKQLAVYSKCLSKSYGKTVLGKYLALVSDGSIIKIS